MRYYWKLILHFLNSNSRHGTHSPFVYKLADEVIYAKSFGSVIPSEPKSISLMKDIASYFRLPIVSIGHQELKDSVCYLSLADVTVEELSILQHQRFMLFITDLYTDAFVETKWQQIKQSSAFVVTIDLFHFGIICYRTEQPKEHFILRFPYWKY